jgi:ligand-binding SRPBCC domain-containing protein
MKTYRLERTQMIARSRHETFAFFSDAFNLERITPPFLRFRILTPPPIKLAAGTLIEYRLKLFGIPLFWRTVIEEWKPEESFVDRQVKGPYAWWRHTHTFEKKGSYQVLMRDLVEYRIPFGLLGRLAHRLFVKRWLKAIFDYRAATTAHLLNAHQEECGDYQRALAG